MTGEIHLANSDLKLSGPGGYITSNSSITANAFYGDGSQLTNLTPANLGNGLISNTNIDASSITKQGNIFNAANRLVKLDATGKYPALDGSLIFNVPTSTAVPNSSIDSSSITKQGNIFNGNNQLVKLDNSGRFPAKDGSQITNINASNISSGQLSDNRLSNNIVNLNTTNFNGSNDLVQLDGNGRYPNNDGRNITNLNASNIGNGTLNNSRLSSSVTLMNNTFNGNNQLVQLIGTKYPALDGSLITNLNISTAIPNASIDASSITKQGNTFNGNNQLVKLDATGKYPALDGSLIANINVTNASIDASSITKQGNTFNGNNQLVKLDATGKYPALDGSLITGLAISSGNFVAKSGDAMTGPLTFANLLATPSPLFKGQMWFDPNALGGGLGALKVSLDGLSFALLQTGAASGGLSFVSANASQFTGTGIAGDILALKTIVPSLGGTGANLSGAAAGGVPYFTPGGVMAPTAVGNANDVLTSQGAASPTWSPATDAPTPNAIVRRDTTGSITVSTLTVTGQVSAGYKLINNPIAFTVSVRAGCGAGFNVMGGGCYINVPGSDRLISSFPSAEPDSQPTAGSQPGGGSIPHSWSCIYPTASASTKTAYVICARIQ